MKKPRVSHTTATIATVTLLCLALLGACAPASQQQPPGEGSGAGEIIEEAEAIATEASEGGPAEEALTARKAFSVAETEAASWASDAVFVVMNTFRESDTCDGRAGRWVISFESAAAQQRLDVHVVRGEEVLQTMEEDYEQSEAISADWIDSPAAMGVADQHVEDRPVEGCWMLLDVRDGTPCWRVQYRPDEGPTTRVEINAVTGAFIRTW